MSCRTPADVRSARRGSVLVLFVLLAAAFLAVAALVIDLGIVHKTRRQLQSAVNVAALEGARNFTSDADGRTDAEQMKDLALAGSLVVPTLDYTNDAGTVTARLARTGDEEVPSLFRRGTLVGSQQSRDAIAAGYTVRAVSRASLRPALAIGPDFAGIEFTPPLVGTVPPGVASFAIRLTDWNANSSLAITNVNATGGLETSDGAVVGQVIRATTLAGNAAASDSSLTVDSPHGGFPTVAPFRIRVDNELLRVTAVAGSGSTSTWAVERAVDGSASAAHTATARVSLAEPLSAGEPLGDSVRSGIGNFSLPQGLPQTSGSVVVPIYATVAATIAGSSQSLDVVVGFGYASVTPTGAGQFTVVRQTSSIRLNASARVIRPLQLSVTDPAYGRTLRGFLETNYGPPTDEEFAALVNDQVFAAYRGTMPIASAVTAPAWEASP